MLLRKVRQATAPELKRKGLSENQLQGLVQRAMVERSSSGPYTLPGYD